MNGKWKEVEKYMDWRDESNPISVGISPWMEFWDTTLKQQNHGRQFRSIAKFVKLQEMRKLSSPLKQADNLLTSRRFPMEDGMDPTNLLSVISLEMQVQDVRSQWSKEDPKNASFYSDWISIKFPMEVGIDPVSSVPPTILFNV